MKTLIILFFTLMLLSLNAYSQDEAYIFCDATGSSLSSSTYISEVFIGDYNTSRRDIERAYYDFLRGRLGSDVELEIVVCHFYDTQREAENNLERSITINKIDNGEVFYTDWAF